MRRSLAAAVRPKWIGSPPTAARVAVVTPQNVFSMVRYRDAALGLIRSEEGRQLLTEARIPRICPWAGMSALHEAVSLHSDVALELIRTKEGTRLLAETKDCAGWSALDEALFHYPELAVELKEKKPIVLRVEMPKNVELRA